MPQPSPTATLVGLSPAERRALIQLLTPMPSFDDGTPVEELLNIGPTSAHLLDTIGIETRADLERAGAVLAYRALKHRHPHVGLNMLDALHGALIGERWDRLSPETKAQLRAEVVEAAGLPPSTS